MTNKGAKNCRQRNFRVNEEHEVKMKIMYNRKKHPLYIVNFHWIFFTDIYYYILQLLRLIFVNIFTAYLTSRRENMEVISKCNPNWCNTILFLWMETIFKIWLKNVVSFHYHSINKWNMQLLIIRHRWIVITKI